MVVGCEDIPAVVVMIIIWGQVMDAPIFQGDQQHDSARPPVRRRNKEGRLTIWRPKS